MQIFVNGEAREVSESETLADLLAELGLEPKHLAVEVNLEVVPRGEHAHCRLAEGDRLEIVTLVGGG
jgi:sulfur carrier protein